jgi:hypothetical protein
VPEQQPALGHAGWCVLEKRVRALVFAAVFFVALLGIGLLSVSSSNYKDVSQLRFYKEPVKGMDVRGRTVLLQPGVYYLRIGDTVFKFAVPMPQPYAVAQRVQGPPLGSDDKYAVFMLRGKDGYQVVALFSAKTFQQFYGAQPVMEQSVVVEGTYDPGARATLYRDTGNGRLAPVSGQLPVFWVSKILEGCHQSYEAPSGRIAS